MKRYWTWAHNIEGCLRNGSFVRSSSTGLLFQYMNGDYMGNVAEVPGGMTEVPCEQAVKLIPVICGGVRR